MEKQRDQALAPLAMLRCAAAEDVVVVEAELEVVARVDDGDDSRRALQSRAQRLARSEVRERRAQRIERGDGEQREVAKRTGRDPGTGRCVGQSHVGDGREQEEGSHSEEIDRQERGDQSAEHPAEEVRPGDLSDRPRDALRVATCRPERGQHRARG